MPFTYENILQMTRPSLSSASGEDAKGALALKLVSDHMWDAYDWRTTLGTLPPFYLTPEEQDYPLPSDFGGLRRDCYLVDARAEEPRYFPLDIKGETSLTSWSVNRPATIGYSAERGRLRVFPQPSATYCAPFFFVTGKYKKTPPAIDNSKLGDVVWTEDKQLDMWLIGMPWAYALLGGSPPERVTSLRAAFDAAIAERAAKEAANSGPSIVAPQEALDWDGGGLGSYVIFG